MTRFLSIAQQIGELVERKNAAYGSSFEKAGSALRLLYPAGIAPEQLDDALLIARIWDKLQRIATDRDAMGESPYSDIAGYGLLGVAMHRSPAQQPHQGVRVAPQLSRMPDTRLPQSGARTKALLPELPHEGVSRAQKKKEDRTLPALRKKHRQKARSAAKGKTE